MKTKQVSLGYEPRDWQRRLHLDNSRFKVLVIHRRAGKTVGGIADMVDYALRSRKERHQSAYIAPYYAQAKKVAWDYLVDFANKIPGTRIYRGDPVHVVFPNGAKIMVLGADNPDASRGLYLDDVILDEYGDTTPRIWSEVIRPALADRKGRATFIGTPKGRNHFAELYDYAADADGWSRMMLKASESGLIDEDELRDARGLMTEDQYAQEFECSFDAAIQGAYYAKSLTESDEAGRITGVPYAPEALVHTSWDLGYNDPTSIWFLQEVGRELRAIDYYEASGAAFPEIIAELNSKPYAYGTHYLPHDVAVTELGTGRSRREQLESLGLNNIETVPAPKVKDDAHNAVRMILPRMWFDKEKCAHGIECLRQYRQEFDEKRKVFRSKPLHDWTSHAADALSYFALGYETPQSMVQYTPPQRKKGWMGR